MNFRERVIPSATNSFPQSTSFFDFFWTEGFVEVQFVEIAELAEATKIQEPSKKPWYSGGVGLCLGFGSRLPMPFRAFQRGVQSACG
jgi:hypothetical protein